MKSSGKTKFLAIVALTFMLGLTSYDAFASGPRPHSPRHPRGGGGGNNVGAPLDGGILTILLGGAGVAYFARRKKRLQNQK